MAILGKNTLNKPAAFAQDMYVVLTKFRSIFIYENKFHCFKDSRDFSPKNALFI